MEDQIDEILKGLEEKSKDLSEEELEQEIQKAAIQLMVLFI